MFSGCYLASSPLPGAGGGGDDDDGDTLVTFAANNPPTANGSATATTTEITFTLSEAIPGLTASDITLSGVAGVTKGTLSVAGTTYTLPISGFTAGGTLTITVTKSGYTISGSHTVTIFYYSDPGFTPEYDVGDTGPGGGIIFYVSTAGFTMTDDNSIAHYLEAAPDDMATTLAWASSAFIPPANGGTDNWVSITGTAEGIGAGRNNTALILATDAAAPAAKACEDYINGSKTDWFLPSRDELQELYNNRTSVGNLKTTEDNVNNTHRYWSSSQGSNNTAWYRRFSDGYQLSVSKDNTFSVRAIRAF